MIDQKIKLSKVLELHKEVSLMMKEKISFAAKYKVNNLLSAIQPEIDSFDLIRNEAIRKLGEPGENDQVKIDETSPNWKEFIKEISAVLNEDATFSHKPLRMSDFEGLISENEYKVLFEVVSE